MNKPIRGAEPPTQLAEDQIADFLVAHPDFFERHGAVLARIKLPHQRGSAAISLVERQVLVLRDKHAVLEKKLHELIENGRANDAISDRMHRLTRRLLRARLRSSVLGSFRPALPLVLARPPLVFRWQPGRRSLSAFPAIALPGQAVPWGLREIGAPPVLPSPRLRVFRGAMAVPVAIVA